jgi:hypothetical protein
MGRVSTKGAQKIIKIKLNIWKIISMSSKIKSTSESST